MQKHLFKFLIALFLVLGFYKLITYFYNNHYHANVVNLEKITVPAMIIQPYAGLGNQLFRYACAYNLAKKYQFKLYLPLNLAKKSSFKNDARDYALDFFHIPQNNIIDLKQLNSIQFQNIDETDILNRNIPIDKIIVLNDYCESEIFFEDSKEEIKKLFKFNENKIADILSTTSKSEQKAFKDIKYNIENTESVCVHVRRGDTTNFKYWTIPVSYQINAIELIRTRLDQPIFYVFSDDINYAKEQLKQFSNMIFVSEHNFPSIIDFYLMTKCKHNIITNSTFSWWAGYLNDNPKKIVIAPLPRHQEGWYEEIFSNSAERERRKYMIDNFSYSKSWLTLNPFDGENAK